MSHVTVSLCPFAKDVARGLTAPQKRLFSKYFYDDRGSRIFQQIMEMPEYYPTNSEMEILTEQAARIHRGTGFEGPFNVVELGAGDGVKTKALLRHLVQQKVDVTYYPLDISQEAMNALETDLSTALPELSIQSLVGDYFEVLDRFDFGDQPSLFLFLGGNIGNYEDREAVSLLRHFGRFMKKGDLFLIGIDLKKNPRTIRRAYDDPHGITKQFNLNLLRRINRELGGNFNLERFDFYAHYNPANGHVRSYLVSLCDQEVFIETLQKTFFFQKNELIYTELSKKYDLAEIDALAYKTGFRRTSHFLDRKGYFADSLWEKV